MEIIIILVVLVVRLLVLVQLSVSILFRRTTRDKIKLWKFNSNKTINEVLDKTVNNQIKIYKDILSKFKGIK